MKLYLKNNQIWPVLRGAIGAMMPIVVSIVAVQNAAAETGEISDYVCRQGDLERKISTVVPGQVGLMCDVRMQIGSSVRVPYRANNSLGYCVQKADMLAADLTEKGYVCSKSSRVVTALRRTPPPQVAEAAPATQNAQIEAPTPSASQSASLTQPAPLGENAISNAARAPVAPSSSAQPSVAQPSVPQQNAPTQNTQLAGQAIAPTHKRRKNRRLKTVRPSLRPWCKAAPAICVPMAPCAGHQNSPRLI